MAAAVAKGAAEAAEAACTAAFAAAGAAVALMGLPRARQRTQAHARAQAHTQAGAKAGGESSGWDGDTNGSARRVHQEEENGSNDDALRSSLDLTFAGCCVDAGGTGAYVWSLYSSYSTALAEFGGRHRSHPSFGANTRANADVISGCSCSIRGLPADDLYEVRVRAGDQLGWGEWGPARCCQTSPVDQVTSSSFSGNTTLERKQLDVHAKLDAYLRSL
jgi:hypothetical protein